VVRFLLSSLNLPSCEWAIHFLSNYIYSFIFPIFLLESCFFIYASPALEMSVPPIRPAVGNRERILSRGIDCSMTFPGPSRVVENRPSPEKQHVQQPPLDRMPCVTLVENPTTHPVDTTITSPGSRFFSRIVPDAPRKQKPGVGPGSIFCTTRSKPVQHMPPQLRPGLSAA